MNRLERLPVPVIPTFVGALTLANVYGGIGYTGVRHITMIAATIFMLVYLVKIIRFPKTCLKEYNQVVPCSLYAAVFMATEILGAYYYEYNQTIGFTLWAVAVIGHAIHLILFLIRNVILHFDINTFVPSWYVTLNGIMVSCVVGSGFGVNNLLKIVVWWGCIAYLGSILFMIYRLLTVEIKDAVYHTQPILLAPCSLCVVSLLNIYENPNRFLLYLLYFCVLATTVFIILKLPKFFRYSFVPGFAGLTFPMAIGIVATNKMTAYVTNVVGNETVAGLLKQLSGIQLYLTTVLVGYVLINFVIMALKLERK